MEDAFLKLDIKSDSVFKYIFLSEIGKKYMCNILSKLIDVEYKNLIDNMYIINSEYPSIGNKSSYSDVVYRYKNIIFIIEMNNFYTKKSIYKNHYYLFFNHIYNANNKNNYNKDIITYLIDIDNFDIAEKIKIDIKKEFVYKSELLIDKSISSFYPNIKTIRINLDYLNKIKYNYNTLKDIERDCLIFVENSKKILNNNIKNTDIKDVIRMFEIMEIDGKFYAMYDKEKYEEAIREEIKENALEEGKIEGKNEERFIIAKSLKQLNIPINNIVKSTGLTIEEINTL